MSRRLVPALALIVATSAGAAENRFGLAAGLVVPVYLQVDDDRVDTAPGPLVAATFDWRMAPEWDLGVFLHVASITAGNERDEQVNAFEAGGAAHYVLTLDRGGVLRFGGGVGYRRLFADEARFDRVQGLAANADAELSYPLAPGFVGQIELGVLSQPYGSNGDFVVMWAPMPYLLLGAVF